MRPGDVDGALTEAFLLAAFGGCAFHAVQDGTNDAGDCAQHTGNSNAGGVVPRGATGYLVARGPPGRAVDATGTGAWGATAGTGEPTPR